MTPFDSAQTDRELSPAQRGYRAIVSVGQLDTDIAGLTPVDPRYQIAGASSDVTVVNIGDDPNGLKVGDTIRFRPNYAALLRLMSGKYIEKVTSPSLEAFEGLPKGERIHVEPIITSVVENAGE